MRSRDAPSPWTALGTSRGMGACLEEVFGSGEFRGRTVAIQGCGHVGRFLAQHLANAGARLLLADISAERVQDCARETGGSVVDAAEVLFARCDVLAPCALGAVFNDERLPRL